MAISNIKKNKLKVLNVYKTYFPDPPGGLQEAIRQICINTSKESIKNTIFTLSAHSKPNYIKMPEADVFRTQSWLSIASCNIGGLSAFSNFSKLAKQADILHYFFPWPFADVLHNLMRPEKPAVLTYVSDVVRQRFLGAAYAPLMWCMLRQMKIIVANCPAYAQTSPILSNPLIRDKVRIIPLGINEDFYPKETFIGIKIAQEISKISYIYFGGEYYRGPRKKSQWHKDISAIFDYEKIEFEQDIWNQRLMMDPEIWNWKFTINRESLRAKSKTQIPNGNTYEISWTCKLFENNLLNEYTENRILVESQEKEKHRKEKLLKEQEQLKKNKI